MFEPDVCSCSATLLVVRRVGCRVVFVQAQGFWQAMPEQPAGTSTPCIHATYAMAPSRPPRPPLRGAGFGLPRAPIDIHRQRHLVPGPPAAGAAESARASQPSRAVRWRSAGVRWLLDWSCHGLSPPQTSNPLSTRITNCTNLRFPMLGVGGRHRTAGGLVRPPTPLASFRYGGRWRCRADLLSCQRLDAQCARLG